MTRIRDKFSGELIEVIVEMLGLDEQEILDRLSPKFQESKDEWAAIEAAMKKPKHL